MVQKDRHSRTLVVYEWRGVVETSAVYAVRVVDRGETQTVEGRGGGVQVGEATHPISELLWEVRAVGAVLEFLRTTRVRCIGVGRVPPEDRGEETDGEEGGPGPS